MSECHRWFICLEAREQIFPLLECSFCGKHKITHYHVGADTHLYPWIICSSVSCWFVLLRGVGLWSKIPNCSAVCCPVKSWEIHVIYTQLRKSRHPSGGGGQRVLSHAATPGRTLRHCCWDFLLASLVHILNYTAVSNVWVWTCQTIHTDTDK